MSAAASLGAPGCTVLHHVEEVMGTVVTIDAYLSPDLPGAPLLADACHALHEADRVFSTWRPHSPMSRLRRGELILADAPPYVAEVLASCAVARRHSWGFFDPWAMPGGLDPTGYVKGWAAQQALDSLRRPGVRGAIVNAAGDVAHFGTPPGGQPFLIGIVDPTTTGRLACVVQAPGAVATSGTYERGPHLVDPRTGERTARLASATVCGADLGMADALATGLAVAGTGGLQSVEALEGYEALGIDAQGRWHWTSSFPFARAHDGFPGPGGRRGPAG